MTSTPDRHPLSPLASWATEVTQTVEVPHGHVLVFGEPDVLYVLLNGFLDLFAARVEGEQPLGRWHPLGRVEGVAVIPGCAGGAGHRIVARVTSAARLVKMHLPDLVGHWSAKARSADPIAPVSLLASRSEFVAALDRTLSALATATRDGLPPRDFLAVDAALVKAAQGQPLRPVNSSGWLVLESGEARLGGSIDHVLREGDLCFTTRSDWLTPTRDVRVRSVPTISLLRGNGLWDAVDQHLRRYLVDMDERVERAASVEASALLDAARRDTDELNQVASSIEATFSEPSRVRIAHARDQDPVYGAVRLIGQRIGLDVVMPIAGVGTGTHLRKLARLLRASNAYSRTVVLAGRWYLSDCGPLLAFRRKDNAPLAVLREGSTYYLIDPTGRERPTEITRKTVERLSPTAYQLYPSVRPTVTGFWSLSRFGLRGSRDDLVRIAGGVTLQGLTALATPLLTGQVLGSYVQRADRRAVTEGAIAVLAAAVLTAVTSLVVNFSVLRLMGRATSRMQTAVWTKLLSLPPAYFHKRSSGELTRRVLGIHYGQEQLTGPFTTAVLGLVGGALNLAVITWVSPRFALVALLLVALALAVAWLSARRILHTERHLYDLEQEESALVLQYLTAIPKLRVTGTEERAVGAWSRHALQVNRARLAVRSAQNTLLSFNAGLPLLAAMTMFALAGTSWRSDLSTSDFLTAFSALTLLVATTVTFSSALGIAVGAAPRILDATGILREPSETRTGSIDPGELSGRIALSGVSFRYGDGPLVLDHVSLDIEPGQFVAVVGPSGSGKSSLLRLLMGFEQPSLGSVLLDGMDLNELDLRAVRAQCGVVLQRARLTPGTIRSNILGTSGLTMKEAWEAADMAGLRGDIEAMPMGMATVVAEGMGTLSGGQQQRLMIARALLTRPRMIFFDEATSALDNPAQDVITQSTRRLNATRVVIAHRLSTIVDADKIVVMDRGRIVQEGTYGQLMAQDGGLFAKLARGQRATERSAPAR